MNENVIVLCGYAVDDGEHGATAHRFAEPELPASGTEMPSVGIENVWPMPLPMFELMTLNVAPLSVALFPSVPVTCPICWFRSGLPESNW